MCSVGRPCSVCVVCGPVVGPIDLVLIIRFRERSTAESGGLGERHKGSLLYKGATMWTLEFSLQDSEPW